jgi:Dolichyl-phosphate-mannose-protein mannosyltransferase
MSAEPRSEVRLSQALSALALLLLAHLAYGSFRLRADLDEFQFLRIGWLVARGERPYLDFWDDHGPLLHQLVSIYYRLGGPEGGATAFFALRLAMLVPLAATAALVALLARRARPRDPLTAALAVVLFAASPVVAQKSLEIRGDNLLHPLWVLSLVLLIGGLESGRGAALVAAGLAVGAGFLLTAKAAMLALASGLAIATGCLYTRRRPWRDLAAFGLGSTLLLPLLLLWQWRAGALGAFLLDYAGEPAARGRFPLNQAYLSLRGQAPLASVLSLLALAFALARSLTRRLPREVAVLAVAGASLVLQYVFLLPVHFLHALLPAVAPLALVQAWALREAVAGRPSVALSVPRALALVLVVLAIVGFEIRRTPYSGDTLQRQLSIGAGVEARVPPGALLFDGIGLPVARPRPLPYPSLVLAAQDQIHRGRIPFDVESELDRRDVAWWHLDGRARAIDAPLRAYRERNFLPLGGDLWVAGQVLDQPGGAEIRVAARYWWRLAAGTGRLSVDGQEAPNPVLLADGAHRFEWTGSGPLVLAATPPEGWPAALRHPPPTRAIPLRGRRP